MSVYYEYCIEIISSQTTENYEYGDIIDSVGSKNLAEALEYMKNTVPKGMKFILVLVRDDTVGRSWAYIDNGLKIESIFNDVDGNKIINVPIRFIKELLKATKLN